MMAIRENAMRQLEIVPDEKLQWVIDYMRLVCESSPPYEVTTKEVFYRNLDEGLEDMRQGRVRPFQDAMTELMGELQQRVKKS